MATPPTRTDKSQFDPCLSSFIPDFSQPGRSSRIEDLLPSNNPPTEFEKADLVKIAAGGPRTLDEYDGKIAATRKLLDFLGSEREQAASNISDAKALVHPVRDLPDDVLRAIFRACTKPVDAEAFNRSFREIVQPSIGIESIQPDQPPWTLSQVCQQWRIVATHTAELWSFIELNLDERPKDKELAKNRVFRLGLQLFRANGRDLSIRLFGKNGIPNISPILQILLPTAQYWKRLSVFLPLSSFQHFSVCKGSLNRLDTLFIGGPSDFHWRINDAFQFIPNLKLLGSFFGDMPFLERFSLPFSRIESFISGGDNIQTYESLKRLPHVQKLFLACCWRPIDALAEPITLHDVTHLHILEPPSLQLLSSSSINMYSHLTLPSLQCLKLSFRSNRISLPLITDPHSCTIKYFTLDVNGQLQQACARLDDELPNFLRRTPKLEELRILATDTKLPGRWVNDLVCISGQDAIAPRLRVLSMPNGYIPAENMGGLVNVVESRRKTDVDSSDTGNCALLERVVLGPEPVWFDEEELSARWSALQAGGLIVTCKDE